MSLLRLNLEHFPALCFMLIYMPTVRVMLIVTGFTFTDLEDYGPLLTLVVGLYAIGKVYLSPHNNTSKPLMWQMYVSCLWPLLPTIGLFFLARELQAVHGTWPKVFIDDPKNWLGRVSPRFDRLFHLVNYLEAYSGAWMVVSVTAFFALGSRFSRTQQRLCVVLTLASCLLFVLDPGHLYAWWLD